MRYLGGIFIVSLSVFVTSRLSSSPTPDILRQRTRDIEVKKYCINLLEKLGSFKYTRDILLSLDKQAREEVRALGPNTFMENLLNELLSWQNSDQTDV